MAYYPNGALTPLPELPRTNNAPTTYPYAPMAYNPPQMQQPVAPVPMSDIKTSAENFQTPKAPVLKPYWSAIPMDILNSLNTPAGLQTFKEAINYIPFAFKTPFIVQLTQSYLKEFDELSASITAGKMTDIIAKSGKRASKAALQQANSFMRAYQSLMRIYEEDKPLNWQYRLPEDLPNELLELLKNGTATGLFQHIKMSASVVDPNISRLTNNKHKAAHLFAQIESWISKCLNEVELTKLLELRKQLPQTYPQKLLAGVIQWWQNDLQQFLITVAAQPNNNLSLSNSSPGTQSLSNANLAFPPPLSFIPPNPNSNSSHSSSYPYSHSNSHSHSNASSNSNSNSNSSFSLGFDSTLPNLNNSVSPEKWAQGVLNVEGHDQGDRKMQMDTAPQPPQTILMLSNAGTQLNNPTHGSFMAGTSLATAAIVASQLHTEVPVAMSDEDEATNLKVNTTQPVMSALNAGSASTEPQQNRLKRSRTGN